MANKKEEYVLTASDKHRLLEYHEGTVFSDDSDNRIVQYFGETDWKAFIEQHYDDRLYKYFVSAGLIEVTESVPFWLASNIDYTKVEVDYENGGEGFYQDDVTGVIYEYIQ